MSEENESILRDLPVPPGVLGDDARRVLAAVQSSAAYRSGFFNEVFQRIADFFNGVFGFDVERFTRGRAELDRPWKSS